MANQLSKEEINTLFKFVESKNVKYKDVQFEIVDHLASAIEEAKANDPNLSFNSALQKIYGKFPITGFASLVYAKEASLKTFWRKKIFNLFLSYLRFPTLFLILVIVYILQLIVFNANEINLLSLYIILFTLFASFRIYNQKHGCSIDKKLTEKYLAANSFAALLEVFSYFNLIFIIPIVWISSASSIGTFTSKESWVLAFFGTLILAWDFACAFHFPKMLIENLSQKYNHLDIKIV